MPRPDMTSCFLSHSSEDKGIHECTACICLVAQLFFIRYTKRLLSCGTKRDLGRVMGWKREGYVEVGWGSGRGIERVCVCVCLFVCLEGSQVKAIWNTGKLMS